MRIAVLGSGIVGLTSALQLARDGHKVTIIAADFGPKTCTYQSEELFFFFHSICGELELFVNEVTDPRILGAWWIDTFESSEDYKRRATISFNIFKEDAERNGSKAVFLRKGRMYLPKKKDKDPWYKGLLPDFRYLTEDELPKDVGAAMGFEARTIFVNPEAYTNYLKRELKKRNVDFVQKELKHIDELLVKDIELVVNCTGLGARTLGGVEDKTVQPVRGQTILAQPKPENIVGEPEWASFRETGDPWSILPRGDGTYILNGTYDVDNYSLEPDPIVAMNIWKKCQSLRPEWLTGARIVSHQVGLRPRRTQGPRIELEERKGRAVLHNYGHGGDGVVLSWGSAKEVSQIAAEYAKKKATKSKL